MSPNRHLKYSIITIKVNKKSFKAAIEKAGSVAMGADGEPKPKTSHSLNPVPGIIYDPEYKGEYDLTLNEGLGISSWPSTLMMLMGFVPPTDYDKSLIKLKYFFN